MKASAVLAWALAAPFLFAADTIPAAQAKDHIGQTATVCGKVVGTRYLDSSNRQPTFLNFDKPYPDHTFTVIIFGENRAKFGKPEQDYLQKDICVTGEIKNYNGKPEIELSDPKQVKTDSK
jgi:DNA/RNA endonuclease YhcR with UshA esterase domain